MKQSLMFLFALATLSFSVNAQQSDKSNTPTAKTAEVEALPKIEINDADREEIKKGAKLVMAGAQGFFGAIRSAVDQVHQERATKEKMAARKTAKNDTAPSR